MTVVVVALAAATAAVMLSSSAAVRAGETRLVEAMLGTLYGPDRFARIGTVVVERPPAYQPSHAINVTSQCSVAFLWLPQIIAFALVSVRAAGRVLRNLVILAITASLMLAINAGRITSIMWSWITWGSTAEWLTHTIVGTIISVLTVVGVVVLQLHLSLRSTRVRRDRGALGAPA